MTLVVLIHVAVSVPDLDGYLVVGVEVIYVDAHCTLQRPVVFPFDGGRSVFLVAQAAVPAPLISGLVVPGDRRARSALSSLHVVRIRLRTVARPPLDLRETSDSAHQRNSAATAPGELSLPIAVITFPDLEAVPHRCAASS